VAAVNGETGDAAPLVVPSDVTVIRLPEDKYPRIVEDDAAGDDNAGG
jgi:hypothetical protein